MQEVVFDWFGPVSITNDVLSQHLIPPTPLVFRHSLLQFWPHSDLNNWDLEINYKKLYDVLRLTGLPNFIKAQVSVPSGLNMESFAT